MPGLTSYAIGGGGAGGSIPGVPALSPPAGGSQSVSQSGSYVNPTLFGAYSDLVARNARSYEQANATYGLGTDILGRGSAAVNADYAELTRQVLGHLQTQGQDAERDINRYFINQRGGSQQDAINRGIGHSSYLGNMESLNALRAGQARSGLYEKVAGATANALSGIGQNRLSAFTTLLGQLGGLYGQQGNAQMAHRFANTFGDVESQYGVNASASQNYDPRLTGSGGGGGFRGVGGVSDPNALRGYEPLGAIGQAGVGVGNANTYRNYGYGSGGYGTSTGGNAVNYGQSLNFDPYSTDDPYGAGHAMDDYDWNAYGADDSATNWSDY